jgi:hypothetical protein
MTGYSVVDGAATDGVEHRLRHRVHIMMAIASLTPHRMEVFALTSGGKPLPRCVCGAGARWRSWSWGWRWVWGRQRKPDARVSRLRWAGAAG